MSTSIEEHRVDELVDWGEVSSRLRMNMDLWILAADKSQRRLNGIETGTVMPKEQGYSLVFSESWMVLLEGKVE